MNVFLLYMMNSFLNELIIKLYRLFFIQKSSYKMTLFNTSKKMEIDEKSKTDRLQNEINEETHPSSPLNCTDTIQNETRETFFWKNRNVTPKNISLMTSLCIESVSSLCEEIIINQRTIHLIPFISSFSFPSYIQPQKKDIQPMIIEPQILPPEEVTPAFMQSTSILLSFLHANPNILSKLVLSRVGKKDFYFLVNSVVPSVYGFFISQEHIEQAFVFYAHVVNNAKPNVASSILAPFFNSIGTFRFIEHVMSSFTMKAQGDKRFNSQTKDNSTIQNFAQSLTNQIKESAGLLPSKFMMIFHLTLPQQWTTHDLVHLFFDCFFTPYAISWCSSSPSSSYVPLIKKIINFIATNEQMLKVVLSTILSVNPCIDLPSMFRPFQQRYALYFITIADITCLLKNLKNVTDLPFSLSDIDLSEFTNDQKFRPFFVKVFPKGTKLSKLKYKSLVFSPHKSTFTQNAQFERIYREIESHQTKGTTVYEMIHDQKGEFIDYALEHSINDVQKQQEDFELLMWYSVHKEILIEHRDISLRIHECSVRPIVDKLIKINTSPAISNELCFQRVSSSFTSTKVLRSIFLSLAEPFYNKIFEEHKAEFNQLTDWTTKYQRNEMLSLDSTVIDNSTNCKKLFFWESVEIFRSVKRVTAAWKFNVIYDGFKRLSVVSSKEELTSIFNMSFVLSEFNTLPYDFLILNEVVVKNPMFVRMASDEEMLMWTTIERFLLQLTSTDRAIQELFLSLQQQLSI